MGDTPKQSAFAWDQRHLSGKTYHRFVLVTDHKALFCAVLEENAGCWLGVSVQIHPWPWSVLSSGPELTSACLYFSYFKVFSCMRQMDVYSVERIIVGTEHVYKPHICTFPTFYFGDWAATFCCDKAVVKVWVGLGTKNIWLGLGKCCVLTYKTCFGCLKHSWEKFKWSLKLSSFVATNRTGKYPSFSLKNTLFCCLV